MDTAVRAHLRSFATTGVAIVGASVIAVTPITMASHDTLPVSTAAVQPVSLVTDVLDDFAAVVDAAGYSAMIAAEAVTGLPLELAMLTGVAAQNPALIPSLASYLAYEYLSPNSTDGLWDPGYLYAFNVLGLRPLAALLPSPLGPSAADPGMFLNAVNTINNAITGALAQLPDRTPGTAAYQNFLTSNIDNPVLRLALAADAALQAPVFASATAAIWLGRAPALVARVIEAAVANPANVPGLLSGLVYSVLDPGSSSLVSGVANSWLRVAELLPKPFGMDFDSGQPGLIRDAYTQFAAFVTSILNAVLPNPIRPTATTSSSNIADTATPSAPAVDPLLEVYTPPTAALRTVTLDVTATATDDVTTATAAETDANDGGDMARDAVTTGDEVEVTKSAADSSDQALTTPRTGGGSDLTDGNKVEPNQAGTQQAGETGTSATADDPDSQGVDNTAKPDAQDNAGAQAAA